MALSSGSNDCVLCRRTSFPPYKAAAVASAPALQLRRVEELVSSVTLVVIPQRRELVGLERLAFP